LKVIAHPDKSGTPVFQLVLLGALCAALLGTGPVAAQTIYRIVNPDGTVSFSDRMPNSADKATVLSPGGRGSSASSVTLPLELRQVAARYPVTLYSSDNCVPCDAGRSLLHIRGIPFTERTVNSADDTDALQRISSGASLPLLIIGGQQIKGFSEIEWAQYLDAAGYPKVSVLPANYRQPTAAPLVQAQKAAAPAKPEEAQNPPPASPAPASPPNPAGIRF
jgi:glutaredoxin